MKTLNPNNISFLQEKPVSFTSTFAEGKLMTISPEGKMTLEYPEEGYDQKWILIPVKEKEMIISSSKNGDMICHNMKDQGNITVKPLSEDIDDCCWKIGKDGEIYQENPNGGERYLWMANDNLFVTLDGFLAEKWIPLNDIKQPTEHKNDEENNNNFIYVFILCIFLFLCVYLKLWN